MPVLNSQCKDGANDVHFRWRTLIIIFLADHFDYIKKMIGAEHLCMGADYNGVGNVPNGMEDVSKYPYLIAELLKRGWTQDEVQGQFYT